MAQDFSNLGAGFIVKAIGEGKRIAYVDTLNSSIKLTNFFENLSLSYSFIKSLDRFQLDIYKFKNNNKISKTIIPQVEFCNVDEEIFWNSLKNYDMIIFDNIDENNIKKIKIIGLLQANLKTQIVCITNNEKTFQELKQNFNEKLTLNYIENNSLVKKKGLINIFGEGKGKSSYSIGYLIREFVNKKDVKLIYFDKGDDIYGDAFFFDSLKKWKKENNLYGNFDYVKTGIKRHINNQYRDDMQEVDKKEAKDALMLLKTSLKKQTPVIADELNSAIEKNLLTIDEVLEILNEINQELIINGKKTHKKILDISEKIIRIE
jgi:ATP:corrinoid adenosyltransferase